MAPFDCKHMTIEDAKIGLGVATNCNQILTEANFGTPLPSSKSRRTGFLAMDANYTREEAEIAVSRLAKETGRNFRFGTPREALQHMLLNNVHPWGFVVFGKLYKEKALYCVEDTFHHERRPINSLLQWSSAHEIFIAEDL